MPSSTSSIAIPAPLRNWLKSQYPTLTPKDAWLQQTISSYHGPRSAADGKLIEYVHEALLNAELSDVAEKAVLIGQAELKAGKEGVLGAGARGAVLLQVVGKIDIGVSAQTQLDVLEARRTARSSLTGSTLLLEESAQASGAGSGIQRSAQARQDQEQPDAEHGDHMTEFNAAEEAATLPATVFPRSMLQLQLSDGFTTVVGFEHRRVPALSMADTPLGAKLLLRDVRHKKGRLFLEPRGVIVKGRQVATLELDAEEKLIDHLREKLGKPPLEKKSVRGSGRTQSAANGTTMRTTDNVTARANTSTAAVAAASAAAGPSTGRQTQPPEHDRGPPSSFDEAQFEEDEAMWAELQEEEAMRRAAAVAVVPPPPQAPVRPTSAAAAGTASTSRRAAQDEDDEDVMLAPSPSPSPSPPPRPCVRKKFKSLQPASSVSPPPRPAKRSHSRFKPGRDSMVEEQEQEEVWPAGDMNADGYEEAVGASFFAEGMSDEDAEEPGEAKQEEEQEIEEREGDFMILERNDRGNPIVLSDSE